MFTERATMRINANVQKMIVRARRFDNWCSKFYILLAKGLLKDGQASELYKHLDDIKCRIEAIQDDINKLRNE